MIKEEIKDHTMLITPANHPLPNWSSNHPVSLHLECRNQSSLGIKPLGSTSFSFKSDYYAELNSP